MQIVHGNVSDGLLILLLQHVVALSFLQLGKHMAGELARRGLTQPEGQRAGSWSRGSTYARLVTAAKTHKASAAAASTLQQQVSHPHPLLTHSPPHPHLILTSSSLQIGNFDLPTGPTAGVVIDAEQQLQAALLAKTAAAESDAIAGLATAMAKAEAVAAPRLTYEGASGTT